MYIITINIPAVSVRSFVSALLITLMVGYW